MSKSSSNTNKSSEDERLIEVARFMIELCFLHGTNLPKQVLEAMILKALASSDHKASAPASAPDHKSYTNHIAESVPPTIPETSELDVVGED